MSLLSFLVMTFWNMTMLELTVGDLVLLDGDKMVIVLNIEYDETVLVWYKGMEGWIDKFRLSPVL